MRSPINDQTLKPNEELVTGNPASHTLAVMSPGQYSPYLRMVELQFTSGAWRQVELCFVNAAGMTIGDKLDGYLEVVLPMEMLSDILYTLRTWKVCYLSMAFKDKQVTGFFLGGVE